MPSSQTNNLNRFHRLLLVLLLGLLAVLFFDFVRSPSNISLDRNFQIDGKGSAVSVLGTSNCTTSAPLPDGTFGCIFIRPNTENITVGLINKDTVVYEEWSVGRRAEEPNRVTLMCSDCTLVKPFVANKESFFQSMFPLFHS